MLNSFSKRGAFVRVVCVLAMVLVGTIGVVQAAHSHSEDSTTPHHVCSICSTAHAGLSTGTAIGPPLLGVSTLATPAQESAGIFRSTEVHCIRPPPAV